MTVMTSAQFRARARANSSSMKIKRARDLTEGLMTQVGAYMSREPIYQEVAGNPDGKKVLRLRIDERPYEDWATLAGDAIHNARAALDHLAGSLVLENGGITTRDTAWPFAKDAESFNKAAKRTLKGASDNACAVIKSTRPWQGGNDWLWLLSQLDNGDKHNILAPVVAGGFGYRWSNPIPDEPGHSLGVAMCPSEYSPIVYDGYVQEVYEESFTGVPERVSLPEGMSLDFLITFGDVPHIGHLPVTETVYSLVLAANLATNTVLETLYSPELGEIVPRLYKSAFVPTQRRDV